MFILRESVFEHLTFGCLHWLLGYTILFSFWSTQIIFTNGWMFCLWCEKNMKLQRWYNWTTLDFAYLETSTEQVMVFFLNCFYLAKGCREFFILCDVLSACCCHTSHQNLRNCFLKKAFSDYFTQTQGKIPLNLLPVLFYQALVFLMPLIWVNLVKYLLLTKMWHLQCCFPP